MLFKTRKKVEEKIKRGKKGKKNPIVTLTEFFLLLLKFWFSLMVLNSGLVSRLQKSQRVVNKIS